MVTVAPDRFSPASFTIATIGETVVDCPAVTAPAGVATIVGGPFSAATTVNNVTPGSADSLPAASVTENSIVRTPTRPLASVLNDTDCNTA